ncbi:MAG: adenylate kinase [Micromonosporaceae bacterium]
MRRVAMVGNAGSGKTTLGRALAQRLGVTYTELDSIYHQPGWRPLEREEFRARVSDLVAADGWVVDGNYTAVRDLVWGRADTVVWFDLPRRTVMRAVIGRTLRRLVAGTELWNGNRESWRNLVRIDPRESIILWAWSQHRTYRTRYAELSQAPEWAHLRFVRLTSRPEPDRLLEALGEGITDGG